MKRVFAILSLFALLPLSAPATASHDPEACLEPGPDCSAHIACRRGQGWVASPELDTTRVGGSHYVDVDSELMPDPFLVSIWIYEETNDISGLQRADTSVDTTCAGHLGVGDTIVF